MKDRLISGIYGVVVCWCMVCQIGLAQETTPSNQAAWHKACFTQISALKPATQGQSNQNIPYKLFAVRERRDWLLVIADTGTYYSFRKLRKVDTLVPSSPAFDASLCKLLLPENLDLKSKPVELGELKLTNYYQFKRKPSRLYARALSLETGKVPPGMLLGMLQGIGNLPKALGLKPKVPKADAKLLKQVKTLQGQVTKMQKTIDQLEAEKAKNDARKKAKQDSTQVPPAADTLAPKQSLPPKDTLSPKPQEVKTKDSTALSPQKATTTTTTTAKQPAKSQPKKSQNTPPKKATNKPISSPKDTIQAPPTAAKPMSRIDSLNVQIDAIVRQIEVHKEMTELQAKKDALTKVKKDLTAENNGERKTSLPDPSEPDKQARRLRILQLLESIDQMIMQLDARKDKDFDRKKGMLLQQQRDLRTELSKLAD